MVNRKFVFWLIFISTGAIAYPLVFWEEFWPLGRIIAGWYSIFVIVVTLAAGLIVLSIKLGFTGSHSSFLDYFDF